MPTVEEVARHVAGIVGVDNDLLLVGEWVARRWQEIANSTTLRALRKTGELIASAPESTGTVAVTQGSKTVTGTGTAFTQNHVGHHFRAKDNWYEVEQVVSATVLLLKSEYTEDTGTGLSYNIVQRRFRLEPDARKLGPFVHMRLRRTLQSVSQIGLNLLIPSRFELNSVPQYVSEMEADIDGTRRVEIYPIGTQDELIHYLYWAKPPFLNFKDYIPGDIDIEALREGVLIDMYRNLSNKFAMEEKIEIAGYYRNEARAQETRWDNVHKKRLLQQDDGLDDLEFILMKNPAHPRRTEDRIIDNAFDQVWYT
jgi:hypothetical protein